MLDDRGRLHAESRPALEYPDGTAAYSWHGARVTPGTTIDVQALTVADIDAQQDARLRRAMIDQFGKQRYLDAKGMTLIHEEGHWGSIYSVAPAGGDPFHVYEIGPCTFHVVPSSVRTGRQAWARMTGDPEPPQTPPQDS